MSYFGRSLDSISNVEKLDNITFNGGTTYALTKSSTAFTPAGANNILISIDGVVQQGNFSVSGSNIVFTFSPTSSNTCDFIMHYGTGLITTPGDSTVTTAKIGADAVDGTKIADDSISDEHLDITAITGQTAITSLADTDKFLVSDASDSGNLKYVEKQYLPSGDLVLLSRVQASGTASEVAFDNIFSTTYTRYLLSIGQCSVDTDTADIRIQWTDSSGSRYTGGHYTGAGKRRDAGNGTDYNQNYIGSASVVLAGDNNNSPNTPAMFHGFIYNNTITDTTDRCIIMGNRVFHSSARHDPMFGFFGASFSQAASVYGFDVFANSGNLEDYDIAIYGLKNS